MSPDGTWRPRVSGRGDSVVVLLALVAMAAIATAAIRFDDAR
jgi:hypothetical protein